MYVHETNYEIIEKLKRFDAAHSGHPTQIVNEEEIDKTQWRPIA